MVLILNPETKV